MEKTSYIIQLAAVKGDKIDPYADSFLEPGDDRKKAISVAASASSDAVVTRVLRRTVEYAVIYESQETVPLVGTKERAISQRSKKMKSEAEDLSD